MKGISKTATLRKINEHYDFGSTRILEVMRFKFDAPKTIRFYQERQNRLLENLKKLESQPKIQAQIEKDIKAYESFSPIIYTMAFIYSIAHFETFLNSITEALLQYYWKTLKTKNKTLTYQEILNFDSIDDLRSSLIQNELMKFSHLSISEKIKYYEERFNVNFKYEKEGDGIRENWNCIERNELIRVFSQRNIILHNGGVINEKYLNSTNEKDFKTGDELKISKKSALESIGLLFRVCGSFKEVGVKKIVFKTAKLFSLEFPAKCFHNDICN